MTDGTIRQLQSPFVGNCSLKHLNWLRVLQLPLTSCSIYSNALPQSTSLFFP